MRPRNVVSFRHVWRDLGESSSLRHLSRRFGGIGLRLTYQTKAARVVDMADTTPPDDKTVPKTLRECMGPLAAGAAQTAMMAYGWAHANLEERLPNCQRILDAAQQAIDTCNALLEEELKRAKAAAPSEGKQ